MSAEITAARADGFLRHRALILVAAGGAVVEGGVLTIIAPTALPVASQVTALPPVAAYHDLRWLFADGQPWQVFAVVVAAVLLAHAVLDATLLRLAWPRGPAEPAPPRAGRAFWSCLALTAVCWAILSPAATLTFGVAVLPFSWPLIGALPIVLGVLLVLSHGGVAEGWWNRLPPLRMVGWVLSSFAVLSASAAFTAHLDASRVDGAALLTVVAVTGLFNARAWYGMAAMAARLPARSRSWRRLPWRRGARRPAAPARREAAPGVLARVLGAIPLSPLAGVLVLVLVIGVARLMFDGDITVGRHPPPPGITGAALGGGRGPGAADRVPASSAGRGKDDPASAVLVVEGWGTWCCDAANGLRALEPQMMVRQFSYLGLDSAGNPLRSSPDDDDVPLPELGDKIAAQVRYLHSVTHGSVDLVAESEGTLGVYAVLARHPDLPINSVVLLSPIIEPGQLRFPGTGQGNSPVPTQALNELNHLVGSMSPYGSTGASALLSSVSKFGAQYFSGATSSGLSRRLVVVPLADALTLPACSLPPGVMVVSGFHGGLLGNSAVLPVVARFLAGQPAAAAGPGQARMRTAAEVITNVATAWRMPDVSATCRGS
ncbi:MAG TPA: hypothetical protein VMG38_06565 [Trebonia sp.]|nr:hypothetical protein [Trebonia sp.]